MQLDPPEPDQHQRIKQKYGLVRGLGLMEATALNMTNMVGFGPFITIPLIIAAMGGPQCMLGWLAGTILALCDGHPLYPGFRGYTTYVA